MERKRVSANRPVCEGNLGNPKSEVIRKYREELIQISEIFQEKDPDYILALTRRGPRIIELMYDNNIWTGGTTVITEKSLDFMPQNQLNGKHVIIFDDIIISGSTVVNTWAELGKFKSNLENTYQGVDVETVSIAIDEETVAIEKEHVDYKKSISTRERFEFSRDIVRVIDYLNKPYDVDYPLLHTQMDSNSVSDLVALKNTYDLTSSAQKRAGIGNYSILLDEDTVMNTANEILIGDQQNIPVNKVRIYYDGLAEWTTITPMHIFSMLKEDVKGSVFAPNRTKMKGISCYNRLMDDVRSYLYANNEEKALYRFIWFLVNYIHGMAFSLQYLPTKSQLFSSAGPKEVLNFQDMCYLFGPVVTEITRNHLKEHYKETRDALKGLHQESGPSGSRSNSSPDIETGVLNLDKKQLEIYGEDLENLANSLEFIPNGTNYSTIIGTIFEAMYREIEIQNQIDLQNRSTSWEEFLDANERLKTGLNHRQVKWILNDNNIPIDNEVFSIAVDYLIDTGVKIPIFYEKGIEGGKKRLERAYRHGENGYDNVGFGYVIDEAIDYVFKLRNGDEHINRISFEKMGVALEDRLADHQYYWTEVGGYTPKIQKTLDKGLDLDVEGVKPTIEVQPIHYKGGKVLEIDKFFFWQWCVDQEIVVKDPAGGVKRTDSWKKKHRLRVEEELGGDLFPSEQPNINSLADILAEIAGINEVNIDGLSDQKGDDLLTAVTTCRNKRTTLKSMQKELKLFFKGSKYKNSPNRKFDEDFPNWEIGNSIEMAKELENYDGVYEKSVLGIDRDLLDIKEDIENCWADLNNSREVAREVQHKYLLWEDLGNIVESIEKHFENHEDQRLINDFNDILNTYLTRIAEPEDEYENRGRSLLDKTEHFGNICFVLTDVFKYLLETSNNIIEDRDKRNISARTRKKSRSLSTAIKDWESIAKSKKTDRLFDSLPTIQVEKNLENFQGRDSHDFEDPRAGLDLLLEVIPQLDEAVQDLESIFIRQFQGDNWSEYLDNVLPPKSPENTLDHRWVLWYDVKDSSGRYDPRNKKRADKFKDSVGSVLEDSANSGFGLPDKDKIHDAAWEPTRDDSMHIFLRNAEDIPFRLEELLELADDLGIFLRVALCKVPVHDLRYINTDTRIVFDSDEAHVLANRLGNYEEEEEEKDEYYSYHSLNISKSVGLKISDGDYLSRNVEKWERKEQAKEEEMELEEEAIDRSISFEMIKLVRAE